MTSETFLKNFVDFLKTDQVSDANRQIIVKAMTSAADMDMSGKSLTMLNKLNNGEDISEILPVPEDGLLKWDEIIGAEREKRDIEREFLTPLLFPGLFKQGTSLLMYGPPGTGKTYICKGIVSQFKELLGNKNVSMFAPSAANIKGGLVGETEKNIRRYFQAAQDAADESGTKSILFMDEVEALAGRRDGKDIHMTSSVNVLLQLLDGVSNEFNSVIFIAATNIPWGLDSAILRRFSSKLFVDLPTDNTRLETIKSVIKKRLVENDCEESRCDALFTQLSIWSGAASTVNSDELLHTFLLQTNRLSRGGIVGMLGYTLSDLTKVLTSSLNKISVRKLLAIGRKNNCIIISDPSCVNCDPCPVSEELKNTKLTSNDLQKHIDVFKEVFVDFKATTNVEEYRNYIKYYSNPGDFKL